MFNSLFNTAPFNPHGYCLLWKPALVFLSAGSDILMALSYFFISGSIIYFVWKKPQIEQKSLFILFAAFILACGFTHLFGAVTIWLPLYYVQTATLMAAATLSVFTAIYIKPKVPLLLTLPTANQLSREIDERKQQEAALREANRQLETLLARYQESESRFQNMADSAPVFIWISNTEKLCTWFNQPWLAFTGRSLSEEYGNGWADGVHPDDYAQCLDIFISHFDRREAFRMEYRLRRFDGEYRWILDNGTPLIRNGEFSGYIGSCIDITDRRDAEQALQALNESLEQRIREETDNNRQKDVLIIQQSRLAAMGEMIGNIAHQWRQPLNTLALILSNIEDAAHHDELTPEYRDRLVRSGNHLIQKMSSTIDDFRHFFRPQKQAAPFSAVEAIEEALSLVSASFHSHHIELCRELGEDVQIVGFANEFSQVLLNLLNNAKDAIVAQQQMDGRVTVRLSNGGGQAQVAVIDNGGGIPIAVMEKMFDPYFSTKEMGTGIGLYMSKMLIEKSMHGTIRARNVDAGAEFILTCPLKPQQPEADLSCAETTAALKPTIA